MMSQLYLVQPPRIAAWLVSLFTPVEEGESILGDLLEEFSHLALKSGVAVARRWYWRQTVRTIAHLAGAGFCVAPWSTTAAVIGGFLLLRPAAGLQERAMFAVLHKYQVFEHHFSAYVFFATDGIAIGHVIVSMFVGCMVAMAAKRREMIATMTLSLVLGAMAGAASLVLVARGHDSFLPGMLPWYFADWFAIVIGGAIVRTRRSATTHQSV